MITVAVGVVAVALFASGTAWAANEAPPSQPVAGAPNEAAAPKAECFPECRAGFMCHEGQCISRCNPPCAAGTECTNDATCAAVAPLPQPTASAAPPAPLASTPPPEISTQSTAPVSRARTHHGFFLRLGLGVGYLRDTTTYEATSSFAQGSVVREGIAQVGELSLGGSPVPGFVIGGGIYGTNAWGDSSTVNSSFIGPFAAYYFRTNGGVNLMVAPCVSLNRTSRDYGQLSSARTNTGWGVVGGVGFDAFVSDNWSLGALLRLQYTTIHDEDRSLFIPSLLFTATYY